MRKLFAIVAGLLFALGAGAQTYILPTTSAITYLAPGTAPPTYVSAVGYGTQTLTIPVFSGTNIDTTDSQAGGFQFYKYHLNGNNPCGTSDITFPGDGSMNMLGCGTSLNGEIATGVPVTGGTTWHGTAYGGGFYVEVTMQFAAGSYSTGTGWPAWWGQPYETTVLYGNSGYDNWGGTQVNGYHHNVEVDFMEYISGNMGMSLHESYGVSHTVTSSCNPGSNAFCQLSNSPGAITVPSNMSLAHQYGVLWVPATATTPGYVSSYVDRAFQTKQIWPSKFVNTDNPPPGALPSNSGGINAGTAWTFGAVDTWHYLLILGTGTGAQPVNVTLLNVWQAGTGNNISN